MKLFSPNKYGSFFMLVCLCILSACTKQEQLSPSIKSTNYFPLAVGKMWVYRLDSTTIPAFGTSLITVSYHVKDSVANTFTDNDGRASWIVYRFITDTLEANPWQSLFTYYVTPTANDVEVVDDNNLRFIKLVTPVTANYTWQGNTFIDTKSANSNYQYLDGWNYTYTAVDSPFTTLAGTFDSCVTVLQDDETVPAGNFDASLPFQEHDYSVEVYAKNTGLVYKDFLHWVWQHSSDPGFFQSDSYGIRLNLIRKN